MRTVATVANRLEDPAVEGYVVTVRDVTAEQEHAAEIALHHHEKWDGSGYPNKLTGEVIPLSARIVQLADIYDALTQVRVYKPALAPAEAERILQGMAASGRLDRRCVQALLEAREQRLAIAAAYVDS